MKTLEEIKQFLNDRNEEALKSEIDENADCLDLRDENGTSLFLYLVYYGLMDVFEFAKKHKKGFSFHEAIIVGNEALVKSMLENNSDLLNAFAPDGFTPIALAAFFNQTKIAKFLLTKGADPGICANNQNKVNALHAAVAKENLELCNAFLESGTNPDIPQMQNVTALHSAAKRGNTDLVRMLLSYGADKSLKMDSGETAYDFVKESENEALKILLRNENE